MLFVYLTEYPRQCLQSSKRELPRQRKIDTNTWKSKVKERQQNLAQIHELPKVRVSPTIGIKKHLLTYYEPPLINNHLGNIANRMIWRWATFLTGPDTSWKEFRETSGGTCVSANTATETSSWLQYIMQRSLQRFIHMAYYLLIRLTLEAVENTREEACQWLIGSRHT